MINLHRLISRLFPDRRPDWEQKREREFIQAANSLKTLKVTPEGGMSIDPEELREQIVASRGKRLPNSRCVSQTDTH
ncbi:hypothetical protein HDC30_002185 [Pseudomonas sp. JAI115]|uniref:hypothetical protein n=1 Tax=Pseudomonas sp. JAI115 TaxID=2723061 RepID=UPI00161E1AD4|nr:hypothetical protein [Pseudomonas sp. JAI115]MBB6154962.1 hypothetical protein [Pseudomonas sp. JAI115]